MSDTPEQPNESAGALPGSPAPGAVSGDADAVAGPPGSQPRRGWTIAAIIFAVTMIFIDQTIVAIAVPEMQKELKLTSTGIQWVVTGYLLAMAAFFALGGRLGDIFGHRKLFVIGVLTFVCSSVLVGLTPDVAGSGTSAEIWIIIFRICQGIGGAMMFPAALTLVLNQFAFEKRGSAMALVFGIAGAMTAIGPIAGAYITEYWDWSGIFFINVPIAIIALSLFAYARPHDAWKRDPIDYVGAALVVVGMGLTVLGIQQSTAWGWGSVATWACIVIGVLILVGFCFYETKQEVPLIRLRLFKVRAFAAENAVLFFLLIVFIPIFFFASQYWQIVLGQSPSEAGVTTLWIFAAFAVTTQIGGRVLDKAGAKVAIVPGALIAAAGLFWWGATVSLDFGSQWQPLIVFGAGLGLVLGPASTDALNWAPRLWRGEATGLVQTSRNFGASLGLAIGGTILITIQKSHAESLLEKLGLSNSQADSVVERLSHGAGNTEAFFAQFGSQAAQVGQDMQQAFTDGFQAVLFFFGAAMLCCFVVALLFIPRGKAPAETMDEIQTTSGAPAGGDG